MLFPIAGAAQSVYDCCKTQCKIVIDGVLDEEAWKKAEEDSDFNDIRGGEYPAPVYKTGIKMLWDDENLYVAAMLAEPDVKASITRRDDIIYHDNDFEVFLDPVGDGRLYYEIETNAFGTVMDLLMEKPYCEGGSFIMSWDCKGLELKTSVQGSVNRSKDIDKSWTVEMKIPFSALERNFDSPLKYKVWRANFSRVEWLTKPEENWVWSPTGVVDIHRPDKWGFIRFIAEDGVKPVIDTGKLVKNWMWERLKPELTDEDYARHFARIHSCGISAVLFEGYDERIYRLCKESGLEAHYWKWTMNRAELLESHPEWFAVNRKGESSAEKPAYVDYYRFLCPTHPEVAQYLADDYSKCGSLKYVDGMHLDYVRFPDVVLPTNLWAVYGIEQTSELSEYDYCYCDACREAFKAQTGRDPLKVKYPMEDQSWIHFRLDAITRVVKTIYDRMESEGVFLSAAVFPGPSMAKKMVRQDWGNWPLKAFFPMTYNGFYNEGPEWIGKSVEESVKTVGDKAAIYPGLFFPDIKGEDFVKALDAAFGAGAAGVSFFGGPDEEYLDIFKAYLEEHHLKPAN